MAHARTWKELSSAALDVDEPSMLFCSGREFCLPVFSGRESFHRCDLDNRSGVYKQLVEFGKVSEMDIRSAPSRLKQPIEFAIEPAAQIDAKITRITMRHPSASIDSSNTG
jgi:hypothetical protein